jgi:hypothetical protein
MRRRVLTVMTMLLATTASAADLSQIRHAHDGACDGTYHNITVFENTTGAPLRIVQGMLLNGGSGAQGAYIARRSDGFFFAPLAVSGNTIHPLRGELVLAPGDGLNLVHWCFAPDHYAFWVIVDYTH